MRKNEIKKRKSYTMVIALLNSAVEPVRSYLPMPQVTNMLMGDIPSTNSMVEWVTLQQKGTWHL